MWDYTMMSGNQTWQWKMMEDYTCIDDLPVKTSIYKGFPIAIVNDTGEYQHYITTLW